MMFGRTLLAAIVRLRTGTCSMGISLSRIDHLQLQHHQHHSTGEGAFFFY